MLPAFVECLVLVGIHSYLGIHVIRRKVIFVDLSLAQIAALGTTVAFLFGLPPQSTGAYWFSLSFTILGAAIFSLSRFRSEKIPQEAIIGLVYALAAAVAILVVDKAPQGAEHIKEIMTGSILWVQWPTILQAAIIYALVGLFHFIFRKRFILISNNPEAAYARGWNVRFWDFLFYVTFGIVITHSVSTAGVLLVFVFLVVPGIATLMLTDKLWLQLVLGWVLGTLVSVIGLWISYQADLPSGPTVVTTYGAVLLLLSLVLYVIRASNRKRAFLHLLIGSVIVGGLILGFVAAGNHFHKTANADTHRSEIIDSEFSGRTPSFDLPDSSSGVPEDCQQFIDEFQQWDCIRLWIIQEPRKGLTLAVALLEQTEIPYLREEIYSVIVEVTGRDFGYRPFASDEENQAALWQLKQWIASH
ncbi:MAG: metal ABC transporter permease [Calditrichaeota bacterium]|nr:metal ABC transporter permease [Calditrichota bacterium]